MRTTAMSATSITVCDNNVNGESVLLEALPALRPLANQSIKTLRDAHPHLFVLSHPSVKHKDGIENTSIYTLTEPDGGATLHTGNVVGFLGLPGKDGSPAVNLRIHSRFDTDGRQYFFQYMVRKVFCPTLLHRDIPTTQENIFDILLAMMFPAYLQRAVEQGIYREYCHRRYNDANVKGPIDITRHIKHNTPFVGTIAYRVREYAYNNRVTQLVHHTIEHLRARGWLFGNGSSFQEATQKINNATENYCPQERGAIIRQNHREVRHPFFTEYEPLRALCMHILQHRALALGDTNAAPEVHGVLFDCAWLWEEYLGTLLKPRGYIHPRNKEGTDPVTIYKDRQAICFPDFYKSDKTSDKTRATVVLDAKYKRYDKWENSAGNPDLRQIVFYLHILEAKRAAVIFPREQSKQDEQKNADTQPQCLGTLNGYGGKLSKLGCAIPTECPTYSEFVGRMKENEQHFLASLDKLEHTST